MQRKILTLLFVLLLAIPVAAGFKVNKAGLPKRPQNSYVYDEDRLLSKQEVQFINALAEELYKKAGELDSRLAEWLTMLRIQGYLTDGVISRN